MTLIKTARLALRPLEMEDAAALFAILGDAEAMRFWDRAPLPRKTTVEALIADELAAMAAGGFHYWSVLKGSDIIGGIDLSHDNGMEAWTGFLFRRDQWGQGYAREALETVIAHAFGPLGLRRLTARIQTGNLRARDLLERLGFQEEGALADVPRDGVLRPRVRYGLDRSISAKGR